MSQDSKECKGRLQPDTRIRSDSRDRSGPEMERAVSTTRSESRDKSKFETSSSKSKDALQGSPPQSIKIEVTRTKSDTKFQAESTEIKKLRFDNSQQFDSDKKSKGTPPVVAMVEPEKKSKGTPPVVAMVEPEKKSKGTPPVVAMVELEQEHKPIKIKLSLAQIRTYSQTGADDSDSATSFEDYEETVGKKKSKRREGSSGKKKKRNKDKDKSRKSKSQTVDTDLLAPPKLELMETWDVTQVPSDAETNMSADPEPLVAQNAIDQRLAVNYMDGGDEDLTNQESTRVCSLCGCGKKSLLCQGELIRFDPTPGFNSFCKNTSKSTKRPGFEVEEQSLDRWLKPMTSKRNRTPVKKETFLSPARGIDNDPNEDFDEHASVGFPDDIDQSVVFEQSGHTWAHHCCAVWSEGVIENDENKLIYVDKAVFSGLSARCSYCFRYGATIKCQNRNCNKIFHYPCASMAGCCQDMKTLSLQCPDHLEDAQTLDITIDTDMMDDLADDSSQHSSHCNEDSRSSLDFDPRILSKMSPSYLFPGRDYDVGLGRGKLVAMARKVTIASKTKGRDIRAPEKRKRPLTFSDKRRGPKSQLHNVIGLSSLKKSEDTDDDDEDHPTTIVLADKNDKFTFDQDICKSCGSFGMGEEGRTIICTQCGQCYHPYCANVKVTKVVLQKGWRCLDCTVCEGCGKPHDEGRLLLCDECDISYHTYCLDPPLQHVPKGTWKCKWCVMCIICGSKSPGFGCQWQRNYTHCAPCHSKISCPVCRMKYVEEELIIQCVQCYRWLHALCDGVLNEDDAEKAAEFGYHCLYCRPTTGQPGPLPPLPPPPTPIEEPVAPFAFPPPVIREPEPARYYLFDGILITQQAKRQIEKTMLEAPKVKRNRRWSKKPEGWDEKKEEIEKKIAEIMAVRQLSMDSESNSTPVLSRFLSNGSDTNDEKVPDIMDVKSPDGETEEMRQYLETEAIRRLEDEKKGKKKRNITKIGVGGFNVMKRKNYNKRPQGEEGGDGDKGTSGALEGDDSLNATSEECSQPKKWQRKVAGGRRRSVLQENFPSYMQEAFFGSDILIKSREAPKEQMKSMESEEDKLLMETKLNTESDVREESAIEISSQIKKQLSEMPKQSPVDVHAQARAPDSSSNQISHDDGRVVSPEAADLHLPDDMDSFDIDENFIKMIESELEPGYQLGDELDTGLLDTVDEGTSTDTANVGTSADEAKAVDKHLRGPLLDLDVEKNAVLDDIRMLSQGLEQIDSKIVEDIFKGVFQGDHSQPGQSVLPTAHHPNLPSHTQHPLQHPVQLQVVAPGHVQQHPAEAGFPIPSPHGQGIPEMQMRPPFSGFPPDFPSHPQYPPNFVPAWSQTVPEDSSGQDSSRRNMQKWESDEDLGQEATISPILYCNIQYPELKQQYPDWSERSKQIAKIWRKLTPDEKQPYLLKARKNRGNIKAKPKLTPEQKKKAKPAPTSHLPGMPVLQHSDVFSSPEGGMPSSAHSSPVGLQSPLRVGVAQIIPGTPEGHSPSHPSPGLVYSGSPQDPYHMPLTPRPQDPYALTSPSPRGSGSEFNMSHGTGRAPGDDALAGRIPVDPYSHPPLTPRTGDGNIPQEFRNPGRVQDHYLHSPGMPQDPFTASPSRPQAGQGLRPSPQVPGMWPNQESDPYAQSSAVQNPQIPPRFERQVSAPPTPVCDDPYNFSSASDTATRLPDNFSHPPSSPQTHQQDSFQHHQRMPMRMHHIPGDGGGHLPPPGPQFRHPFRPQHMHPGMTRHPVIPGDPYAHQPGTPHPRLQLPMPQPGLRRHEPSAVPIQGEARRDVMPFMNANVNDNERNKQEGTYVTAPGFASGVRPMPDVFHPTGPGVHGHRNTGPGLLEEWREKVMQEAKLLGYVPSEPPENASVAIEHSQAQVQETGSTESDALKKKESKTITGHAPKSAMFPDEERPDDSDLGDFLSADGTFDILKYADPDLDLGSDNKTIFDDLEMEDTKPEDEKKDKGDEFSEVKTDIKKDIEGSERDTGKQASANEFQTKFLEFSARKPREVDRTGDLSKQIQDSGMSSLSMHRMHTIKAELSDGSETAGTPSVPETPITSADQNVMRPGQFQGIPSPHMYGQPSPGMPSPKVLPSPKSQPSPRTPADNQIGQQMSPFSQPTHSPFSPNAPCNTSAPQSPYAGNARTQSPFAVPGQTGQSVPAMISQGSPLPTSYSPGHTPPTAFPVQRSPRASMPQTGQFVQFPQQGYGHGSAPRGMVPGHPFNQPGGMRSQVPGIRPPTSLALSLQHAGPVQNPASLADINSPGMRPMHPGLRPPFQGHPPSSPGKQCQGPSPIYSGMPGMMSSTPGTQPSQPFISQPTLAHGVSIGSMATGATTVTTTACQSRTPLLQDQPLLIQDLLEQEKLEQEKRLREQQGVVHRTGGIRPEGIMGPRLGGPCMVGLPSVMPQRMEGSIRHPAQSGMFPQPEMPGMRPRLSGPPSLHTQGQPPFPIAPQVGVPGPMPPPKPPTPVDTAPDADRQHFQYNHWLMRHGEFLDAQVKFLEQQIQKQKRTKKAINARNRQAKKQGQEMPHHDVMELERASLEQSMLQKQLEQMRKQNRQHQIAVQDYNVKQQERFNQQMSQSRQVPQSPVSMPGMVAGSVPIVGGAHMQPPPPRMPGSPGTVRLTQSRRPEYMYMQQRLYPMNQTVSNSGQRMVGPRPPHLPGAGGPQPQMAIGDNNPFSDTYQQQEQIAKFKENHSKQPGDILPESQAVSHMFNELRCPEPVDQHPPRFPGHMEGPQAWVQQQQQQQQQQQRFPIEGTGGPRHPVPGGDNHFPAPFAGQPPPGSMSQSYPPGTQSSASQQPSGKPPPMQFKPQDETERRIMEILSNTANIQRGQTQAAGTAASSATTVQPTPLLLSTTETTASIVSSVGDTQTIMAPSPGQLEQVQQNIPSQSPGAPTAKPPAIQGRITPGSTGRLTPGSQGRLTPGGQGRMTAGYAVCQAYGSPVASPSGTHQLPTIEQSSPNVSSGTKIIAEKVREQSCPQVTTQPRPLSADFLPSASTAIKPTSLNSGSLDARPNSLDTYHMTGHAIASSHSSGQLSAPVVSIPSILQNQEPCKAMLGQLPVADQIGPTTKHHIPSTSQLQPQAQRPVMPAQTVTRMSTFPAFSEHRHAFHGLPPNHPAVQAHLRQIMQQRAELTQFPPAHPLSDSAGQLGQRPHVLPHWVAPDASVPGNGQARKSPRPVGAGVGTVIRTGLPSQDASNGSSQPSVYVTEMPHVSKSETNSTAPQTAIKENYLSSVQGISSNRTFPQHAANSVQLSVCKTPEARESPVVVPQSSDDHKSINNPSSGKELSSKSSISEQMPMEPSSRETIDTLAQTRNVKMDTEVLNMKDLSARIVNEEVSGHSAAVLSVNICKTKIEETKDIKEYSSNTESKEECSDGMSFGASSDDLDNDNQLQKCTDGIHCGTPPPGGECTDGIHCGTPPPGGECTDGMHCGTPPPGGECTDGIHCGTPPPGGECTDGIHCGTPPPGGECTDGIHCGTPPPGGECTDGMHCGTPPPGGECTDGIHCGTPPPGGECTDGIHCGTPPPGGECTDGMHCGTPPPGGECTDGIHCGTPPPGGECTDGIHGIHCGTPPPGGERTDGMHCGTPPPGGECTDGMHCGTPPPGGECTDGVHCGTPPPGGECTDGIHCGTPPPGGECTDGIHCGTPPPGGDCTDGIHCGTPPPGGECTDGIHCGTPPPGGECTDGIHCGTPPPGGECTDGIHCGTPPHGGECTDGMHCGTPPPGGECTDSIYCGTPPPGGECTDGIHCGTPPPGGECTDGIHCGTPPPGGELTDGKHCGTPPLETNGGQSSSNSYGDDSTAVGDNNIVLISVTTDADPPPSFPPVLFSPQPVTIQDENAYLHATNSTIKPIPLPVCVANSSVQLASIDTTPTITPVTARIHSIENSAFVNPAVTRKSPEQVTGKPNSDMADACTKTTSMPKVVSLATDNTRETNDTTYHTVATTSIVNVQSSFMERQSSNYDKELKQQMVHRVSETLTVVKSNDSLSSVTIPQLLQKPFATVIMNSDTLQVSAGMSLPSSQSSNSESVMQCSAATTKSPTLKVVQAPSVSTAERLVSGQPHSIASEIPTLPPLTTVPKPQPYESVPSPSDPLQRPRGERLPSAGQSIAGRTPLPHSGQQPRYDISSISATEIRHRFTDYEPVGDMRPRMQVSQLSQGPSKFAGHGVMRPEFRSWSPAQDIRMSVPSGGQGVPGSTTGFMHPSFGGFDMSRATLEQKPRLPFQGQQEVGALASLHQQSPVPDFPTQDQCGSLSTSAAGQDSRYFLQDSIYTMPGQPTSGSVPKYFMTDPRFNLQSAQQNYNRHPYLSSPTMQAGIARGPLPGQPIPQMAHQQMVSTASSVMPTSKPGSMELPVSVLATQNGHSPVLTVQQGPPVHSSEIVVQPSSALSNNSNTSVSIAGSETCTVESKINMQSVKSHTPPVPSSQSANNRSTPISRSPSAQCQSPAPSAGSQRSSPAQSQSPGHSLPISSATLDEHQLPSVSETFAAAGMMRLGENVPGSQPAFVYHKQSLSGPGQVPSFSSVSSIVQAVSTVSFPGLSLAHTGAPLTEISLPPTSSVKLETLHTQCSSPSFSAPAPVHVRQSVTETSSTRQTVTQAHITGNQALSSVQSQSTGSVGVQASSKRQSPIPAPQQVAVPGGLLPPGGSRMVGPHSNVQSSSVPQQPARARPPRQQQPHVGQQRFPVPSNLPPHLAGMLTNMGPNKQQPGYSQQERHIGPMGQLRLLPGHSAPMAAGGPRGFPVPVGHPGTGEAVPASSGMQMQPSVRHPRMQHHAMQGMRHPSMRQMGPGAQMGHMIPNMHPGQISPTGHPGGPQMHLPMHSPTSSMQMMGPPGMSHLSIPHSSPEMQLPRHSGASITPGSGASAPSPTGPQQFPHTVMPPTTNNVPSVSTPPGFPGDMHPGHSYPFQRLPGQRMHYDPRMSMDPRMHFNLDDRRQPLSISGPRFPPGFQFSGMQQIRPGSQELEVSSHQFEHVMRMSAAGHTGHGTTTPSPGISHAGSPLGTHANSTAVGLATVKEEPTDQTQLDLASHNALLKKLLAKSNAAAMAAASGKTTPQSDHSEDSNDFLQLTPAQQYQLEMIEKMPYLKERPLSEPGLMDSNDPDIESKRLEFEKRRKEKEEAKREKRKGGEVTPRKRKKKKTEPTEQDKLAMLVPQPGPSQPLGSFELPHQVVDKGHAHVFEGQSALMSPDSGKKKRIRKQKKEKVVEGENIDAILETFTQQLKQLPPVQLMEPFVGQAYALCSLAGFASDVQGDSLLTGVFGKTKVTTTKSDFYEDMLQDKMMYILSAKDEQERRKLGIGSNRPDLVDLTDEQRQLRIMMDSIHGNDSQRTSSPFGLGSLGGSRGAVPLLPQCPRIEPKRRDLKNCSSPDSVIFSSSPETGFCEDEKPEFPMLRPIEPAEQDREAMRTSPTVPLLHPVPIKYPSFLIKQESLTELERVQLKAPLNVQIPSQRNKQSLDTVLSALTGKEYRDYDSLAGLAKTTSRDPSLTSSADTEVSVTLTLSAKAAEDIGGVLSAIADLLKIAAPPTYELSRSPPLDRLKSTPKHKEEALKINSLLTRKQTFCCHCEVIIINAGVRKRKIDIPYLTKEEQENDEDVLTFCSMNCYVNFTATRQITLKPPDTGEAQSIEQNSLMPSSMTKGLISPSASKSTITPSVALSPGIGADSMKTTCIKSGPPTPQLGSPTLMRQRSELGKRLKRSGSFTEPLRAASAKKWKDVRYRQFDSNTFPEVLTILSKENNETELWTEFSVAITHDRNSVKDLRMCEFCQEFGDGSTNGPGRLLNMDINKWAHLNCALWSQEVYETLNGALMNVQQAYKRGMKQKCVVCIKPGASMGCFKQRCNNIYHVACAQLVGCMFFEDKTIFCPPHSPKVIQQEQVLKSLVVFRRVYINRDEDSQVANMLLQDDGRHTLRLGSLILHNIGQLLPHQMANGKFNSRDHIYPVGYKASRLYWSMRTLYKRCRYICKILEKDGQPEFVVTIVEDGFEDFSVQNSTCAGVWRNILEPLEKLHKEADLVKVFPLYTAGEELYGLTEQHVVRLLESLPGTDLLRDYAFRFGRRQLIDLPLTINPSGCARSEPKLRTHFKRPHTLQSSSTHSLPSTVTGLTGDLNSPYLKHFIHSKSQQYRRLKTEWKNLVYLGRSRIQGLGLYAAKDLEMHTMVIEYIGELIRNEVANRREKTYESQNRGVYMFRIDNDTVCDATMAGGPARYINHSCDPNCVAEVEDIDKESKIIIITNRRISKGEELSYDYLFDFEDDQHKIPCNCGAPNCRKWMN